MTLYRRPKTRRPLPAAVAGLCAALSGGCEFDSRLDFFTDSSGGEVFVSLSLVSQISECANAPNSSRYVCTFTPTGGAALTSSVTLDGAPPGAIQFIDPVVVQLPAAAGNISGSYSHRDSNAGGVLSINTGLRSIRADNRRTINAEGSAQLVTIELPDGAPRSGNFAFNVNFTMPSGTTVLPFKALFAGRVDAGGERFYAPLLPCTTDMARVPGFFIPLPDGGLISLPPSAFSGCADARYEYPALPSLQIFINQFEAPPALPGAAPADAE